jgi:hypothetical protein
MWKPLFTTSTNRTLFTRHHGVNEIERFGGSCVTSWTTSWFIEARTQYIWTIKNHKLILAQEKIIESPSIYLFSRHSSKPYLCRLELHPEGNQKAKGTHCSLFIRILRTPEDNEKLWPLSGRIDLSVRWDCFTTVREHIYLDETLENFTCRPTNETNEARGFPYFFHLNEIESLLTDGDLKIVVSWH